eukprot:TRINITY_DN10433_c3_g1_i1.p1 TRINITY_DN10433_c3_g1~~TRINITY_DN10433_c3_g1_i1.p1  ORF type:complete len:165 (+),score=19.33 TRINITY_DN10433_c3_g1_i1:54-497(+)
MSASVPQAPGYHQMTRRPMPMVVAQMDTMYMANLRASVADRAGQPVQKLRQEKDKLREQRWQRGKLLFMDRMEVDSRSRRAYSEVCELRRDQACRQELERRIAREKAKERAATHPPTSNGPVVATYSRHACSQNHGKAYNWAPLELY